MDALALSIVIPAYNEEARIGGALTATRNYLDRRGLACEVIVVDDGSTDRTRKIVEEHAIADPRVKMIRLQPNRGKGAAVRAGMLASRGQRALFMDADLATPLEELEKLEQALDGGAAIAIGSRALDRTKVLVRQHPLREAMGRSFNLLVRGLGALDSIPDTQCGFKLFSRRAVEVLFREATIDRFAFDVELLVLARGRFAIAQVPVAWRHVDQSKVSPVRDAMRMAWDLIKLRMRRSRG